MHRINFNPGDCIIDCGANNGDLLLWFQNRNLDIKYIGSSKIGDEIIGNVKILKKTKTLVFLFCELKCNDKIITSASGVWKILK